MKACRSFAIVFAAPDVHSGWGWGNSGWLLFLVLINNLLALSFSTIRNGRENDPLSFFTTCSSFSLDFKSATETEKWNPTTITGRKFIRNSVDTFNIKLKRFLSWDSFKDPRPFLRGDSCAGCLTNHRVGVRAAYLQSARSPMCFLHILTAFDVLLQRISKSDSDLTGTMYNPIARLLWWDPFLLLLWWGLHTTVSKMRQSCRIFYLFFSFFFCLPALSCRPRSNMKVFQGKGKGRLRATPNEDQTRSSQQVPLNWKRPPPQTFT